jgi:hypothetical protein
MTREEERGVQLPRVETQLRNNSIRGLTNDMKDNQMGCKNCLILKILMLFPLRLTFVIAESPQWNIGSFHIVIVLIDNDHDYDI